MIDQSWQWILGSATTALFMLILWRTRRNRADSRRYRRGEFRNRRDFNRAYNNWIHNQAGEHLGKAMYEGGLIVLVLCVPFGIEELLTVDLPLQLVIWYEIVATGFVTWCFVNPVKYF